MSEMAPDVERLIELATTQREYADLVRDSIPFSLGIRTLTEWADTTKAAADALSAALAREAELLDALDTNWRLKCEAEAREAALRAENEHLRAWRDAVIDATIVDWIYTKEHEHNPRKAVNDLLAWQAKLALDPAVSKEAGELMQRGAESAEAHVARLEAALKLARTYIREIRDRADDYLARNPMGAIKAEADSVLPDIEIALDPTSTP